MSLGRWNDRRKWGIVFIQRSDVLLTMLVAMSFPAMIAAAPLDNRQPIDDVFYQLMPIAWRDSDNDAQRFGDFDGMTASLDYLEDLGVTAVWMNPIFISPAYHGYQHGAGDEVNPRFGTEAQFLNFVQQAHARGIKVFLDFVVYGISHDAIWYQSAFGNPGSPYDNWLAFTNGQNTQYSLGAVFSTWNGDSVGFIHWNLNNPDCSDLVTDWCRYWLDPNNDGDPSDGIDGYRLDHVSSNHPQEGVWGYNINWWVQWKADLLAVNPDVFTFAEQADWGNNGVDLLPAHDATMTKPFEFAARDAIANETAGSLYSAMNAAVNELPPGRMFMGIIGDHDVDRLTSVIGGSLTKAKVAAAVLMTQPFTPMIYYGDEIGMLGFKGNFGSDANDIPMREPFKWNAIAGPPMSNYWTLNAQAYNNRYSTNNDGRSVEEQLGVSGSLLEAYKSLIALRKSHVALRRGDYFPVSVSTSRVWCFLRYAEGEETLLIAINVHGSPHTFNADLGDFEIAGGTSSVQSVVTGQTLSNLTDANKASYPLTLSAYGYDIFAVDVAPPAPDPNALDGVDIPQTFLPAELVATQDNATALGDNIAELNQLFVRAENDGYRIGITGNLAGDGTGLCVCFDTTGGGHNVLDFSGNSPPPAGPDQLTGMQMDAGFAPDHMLFVNTFGGNIYVDQFMLPTSGGATKAYRGNGTVNDGDGLLNGGSNPNGMQVAMNNTNALGVTGSSVADAATATSGFEMFVPYDDIGVAGPGTTIRMAAFILKSNGDVSNQWLPGLGGGQGNLGVAPDLSAIAGQQFAVVSPVVAGDIDADGDADLDDLVHFVNVVLGTETDACRVSRSDLDNSGAADGEDVGLFMAAVLP